MPCETNIIYCYDGTFDGLLSCVFESVYCREVPAGICPADDWQPSLFEQRVIRTDTAHAARVYASLDSKVGVGTSELVKCAFLSCAPDKEMHILRFLRFGYKSGPKTVYMLSHALVAPLYAAQRALRNEVHLLTGFVRFSDYGTGLVAEITPKNYVLPFLAPHFCARFGPEQFLIFDKTHKAALVWQNHVAEIISINTLETPPPNSQELAFRALWKRFYESVAIAARYNPRCRMSHMPKRYWENMTEFASSDFVFDSATSDLKSLSPAQPLVLGSESR